MLKINRTPPVFIFDSIFYSFLLITVIGLIINGCGGGSNDGHSDDEIRYVAIGASDAVGIGATPLSNGYVFRIEKLIKESGRRVSLDNLGIPGAKADLIVDTSLKVAREINPDIITVFVGANDLVSGRSVSDFKRDLNSIFTVLRNDTSAFIVVANLPKLSEAPAFAENPDPDVTLERVAAYNEVIQEAAAQYKIALVDLGAISLDDSLFNEQDGFHPSDEGHAVIAEQFFRVINPQLALIPPPQSEN